MNRVHIGQVLLTVVLALGAGGCFAAPGGDDDSPESGSLGARKNVAVAPSGDDEPASSQHELHALSGRASPGEQNTGPFPEPWQRTGPFPEPWLRAQTNPPGDPGNAPSGDPNNPTPGGGTKD